MTGVLSIAKKYNKIKRQKIQIKIAAIHGPPKQAIVTEATGCSPQKLKSNFF
jgi:hypothetical protein